MREDYYWIKTKTPDMRRYSELVKDAKGDKTSQQFAEECGVNTSTITRIINRQNKGASKYELIKAIADHADPNSGVTLEALMEANGMTKRRVQSLGIEVQRRIEESVQGIFYNELLNRGASIRRGNIRYNISKSLAIAPDIMIMTDALSKTVNSGEGSETGEYVWFIECLSPVSRKMPDGDSNDDRIKKRLMFQSRNAVFQKISRSIFISLNRIEVFKPLMYSVITTEKEVYDDIVSEFGEMPVPINMSIIYINLDFGKVVDEFVLPRADGETMKPFFDHIDIDSEADEEDLSIIKDNDEDEEN